MRTCSSTLSTSGQVRRREVGHVGPPCEFLIAAVETTAGRSCARLGASASGWRQSQKSKGCVVCFWTYGIPLDARKRRNKIRVFQAQGALAGKQAKKPPSTAAEEARRGPPEVRTSKLSCFFPCMRTTRRKTQALVRRSRGAHVLHCTPGSMTVYASL